MRPRAPLRILVVDDNVDAAEMVGALLETMGHAVRVVHDGARGLAELTAYHPDVAILDLGLPELDGLAVATQARANPALASITLIALSGYAQPEDIARSRAAGFAHHLA